MQIITCTSIQADKKTGDLLCIGQVAVDARVLGVSSVLNPAEAGVFFGAGFSSVGAVILVIWGFRRIYYLLPRR